MKNASLYLRVDGTLKDRAQEVLSAEGYSMAKAIDIFLQKISMGDLSILEPSDADVISEYPAGFFDLFGSDTDKSMRIIKDVPAGIVEEV